MNEIEAITVVRAFMDVQAERVKFKTLHVLHNNEICEFEIRKYKGDMDLAIRGKNWGIYIENPIPFYSSDKECLDVKINKDIIIKFNIE